MLSNKTCTFRFHVNPPTNLSPCVYLYSSCSTSKKINHPPNHPHTRKTVGSLLDRYISPRPFETARRLARFLRPKKREDADDTELDTDVIKAGAEAPVELWSVGWSYIIHGKRMAMVTNKKNKMMNVAEVFVALLDFKNWYLSSGFTDAFGTVWRGFKSWKKCESNIP